VPEQSLAGRDHRVRAEPGSLARRRLLAAQDSELAAVEGSVRPQPQAERPVPAELAAPVLGQTVQPATAVAVPQRALDHAAAAADHQLARHQQHGQQRRHACHG